MNKIFRVIWNQSLQSWQVVSELAKGRTKSESNHSEPIASVSRFAFPFSFSLIALAVLSYQPAQAVIVNNDGGALANGGNTAGTLSDGHAVLLGTNNTIATALNRVTSPIIIGRNNLLTVPRTGSGGTIEDAVLIGNNITVGGAGNSVPAVVAIGRNIRNVAQFGVTIGDATSAGSNGGVAIGKDAGSYGEGATAIGYGAIASGRFANGAWTTSAARTTAIGANASALAANAVAIGSKANATTANSIALGSDSVSSEATNVTNMTIGGVVYELTDHNVSSSNSGYSLSIGNDTIKRQIKNVGAGNVSASSTDAINGSQLYHAIKGIQDTGHYGYFHVNNGSSALVGGDSDTNFGLTGYTAGATGANSLAAGVNAKASNNETTAVGYNTTASGNHSVAMGSSASATGESSVAVGTNTSTRGIGIAVGRNSEALNYGTAFGSNVTANGGGSTGMSEGAVAIGNAVSSLNRFSTAVGINSYTGSERATVVGANNTMGGWADSATAVGYNITVGTVTRGADGSISGRGGDHTVALGNNLNVSAGYATVTGSNNTVQSSAAVYGNNNTVAANSNGAVVLGNNIAVDANRGDAVYLGSGSAGNDVANTTSAQIGSLTLNDFAGTVNSSSGFVSVGNSTAQRKIINLAAGNISATSTEAINGSQLYQAITNVGFNLQENGAEKSRINNNNIINFTNGSYTTANVSGANNATVKFDVVTQTITSTDGIAATTGTTAGLATAADVVSAVNNSAFKLRANGAGSDTIKAGDTLNFTNGSNILITNPSTDTINVAVVNNPTFSGLVTAQGGVNVTGGGLRVSGTQTVNFGGNKLQGIANGTANTDAVAVAQLNAVNTTISGLQTDVEDLTDDLNQAKGDITNLGLRLDSTNTNVTNAQNTANTAETNAQRAITIASSKLEQIRVRANGQAVKTLNSSSNVLNFVNGNNTAVSNDGNGNIKVDAWRTTVDKQGDDIVVTPDVNEEAKTANYTISLNSTLKQQIVDTNTTANAANTTANTANTTANTANTTANTANTTANTANTTANTANTTANTANTTANTANTTANTANTTANTANTTANAAKELAEKGLKVTADKTGTGNVSGNVEHTMALGDTLTIEAGDNVNITQAQNKISIAINKDPSLGNITATQITTGNNVLNGTGLTVGDVAITNAGINAGGKQITNMASGGDVESNAATIGDIKRLDTNTQASVALLDDSGLNLDSTATNTANGTTIYKLGLSNDSKTSLAKADSALQSFQIGANDETSFGTINQADNTVRFNNGTHTEAVRSGNNITFNVKEATVNQGDLTTDFAQDTVGVVNGTVLATTANTLRDLINTATETTSLTATSGKIDTPTDGAKLMNATKVADAINAAGFTLKDKAADTGELITAGDSVIITEGTNINVSRNGETITIKTNETLNAKSVTGLENAYNGDTNGTHAASIQAVKDIVRDNAEWKIQNNVAAAQSVGGAKNVVNFVDGTQTSASVSDATGGYNVTFNVNQTDIVKEDGTYKAKDNGAGLVTAANVAAQLSDVASTLTGKGFVLNTNATTDGALGENSEENKTVALGETVTFEADKNIQLTQKGTNVTIRTKDNVTFTNVDATQVNATTFNAGGNILNGTGLTVGTVTITNANGINAGDKAIANVKSVVAGANGNATMTNIAAAKDDTLKNAATIGDLQAVANAGKTTLSSDGKTVQIGEAVVNATTGAVNYNLEVENTKLTVLENKIADVATDDAQKFVNASTLVTALNGIGFKLQENSTEKGAVTAGNTLQFTDGSGMTVSVENSNGVATVKFDANTTAITVADNGAVTEPTDAKQLITAQNVAKAIKSAGFTLKTSAGTEGERDTASTGDEVINTGEAVEIIAGKNLRVKQATNGQITLGTLENVTFTNVDATQVNATTFNAGGNILNGTGLTVGTVTITNANGINAGDKAITNVNSTVKGTSNAETAKNIVAASGDTLKQAATIGDLQAATNAGKTEVKGSKQATVTSETGGSGQTIYTVAATKTTLTSENSAALTINDAQEDTNGVIAYTATINTADLSAENSKIKAVENADKGKLMTVEAVASAINSVGFNLQENSTARGAMLVGDTLNIANGDQTAVNMTNENNVTTVKVNVNQTDIVKGADGNYAAKDNGKGLVTAANVAAQLNDVASTLTGKGFVLNTTAATDGALGENSEENKTVALGETVTFEADKNIQLTQKGTNVTIRTQDNVTFTNVNATQVNATTFNAGGNVFNTTGLTVGTVTITNADGINAGDKAITNVNSTVKGTSNAETAKNIVAASGDTLKQAATIGDLQAATNAGKTEVKGSKQATVTSDTGGSGQTIYTVAATKTTLTSGNSAALTINDAQENTNGVIAYTATINTASLSAENSKIKAVENADKGKLMTVEAVASAINSVGFNLQENSTARGAMLVGDTLNIANGDQTAVNVTNENNVTTVKVNVNQTDIVKEDGTYKAKDNGAGLVTAANVAEQLSDVATTLTGKGFVLNTNATTDGALGENSEKNKTVALGETVTFEADKNIQLTQKGTNVTIRTQDNVTFTNVDATQVNATTFNAGGNILNGTGLTVGTVTITNADGINAGDKAITNVNSTVKGTSNAETAKNIVAASGNTLKQAATIGDLQAATNAGKTEVKGSKQATVTSDTGASGQTIYTVAASKTTLTSGNSAALTINDAQENTNGVIAYTATINTASLSAEESKIKAVEDTDKGKLMTVEAVASAINSVGFNLQENATAKGAMLVGDTLNIANGDQTAVNVTNENNVTTVKVNVNQTDIVKEGETYKAKDDGKGLVTAANVAAQLNDAVSSLTNSGIDLAANVVEVKGNPDATNVTHKLGNRIDIVKAEGEITEDGKTYIGDNLITKVTQDEEGNSKVEIGLAKNIEVEEIVLSKTPNTTTINGDGVKVETKDGDAVTAQTTLGADGVGVSGEDGASLLEKDGLTVVNPEGELSKVTAEGMVVTNNDGDITGVTADGVAVNGANGTSTLSDNTLAISGKDGQDGILATVTEQGSALSLKGKDGENGITFTATDGENGKSEIRFNDNNGVVDGLKGIVNAATPENEAPIDITTIQDENRTAYNNQAVSGNDLFNLIDNGLRLAANVLPEGAANVTHKLGNRIDIVKAEGEITEDGKTYIGDNLITKVTQDDNGNSKVEIGLAKNIEVEEIVLSKTPNTTTINGDGVKVETKDGDAVTAQTTLGADGVGVSGEDGASLLEKDGLTVVNPEGELSKVTAEGMVVTNNDGDITGVTADGVAVNGANGTSTLSDNTLAISGKDGQDGILATVIEQGSALSLKGKDGENGITFTATDGENGKSEIRFNDNNGVVDGLKGIVNAATPTDATSPIDITTIQGENRTAYNNQAVSGNDLFNLIDNGLRLAANVLPEGAANVTHKLGNRIDIVKAEGEITEDGKTYIGDNLITKVTQDEDGNSKVEIGLAKNIEVEEIVLSREPNTTTINGDGVKVETKDGDAVTAETQLGADGLSAVNGAGDESKVTAEGVLVSNDKGDITGVTADGVAVNGANGTSTLSDNTLAISGKDGQDGILATVTEQGSALSLKGKDGENGITFTATDGENGKSEIRFNDNNGVVDGLKGIVNAATPTDATSPIDITTIQDENRTAYNNQAVSGNDLFNLIDNGLRLAANVLPEGAANVTHKLGNQINIVAAEEVIKDASEKEFVGKNVITKVTQDEDGNSKVEIGLAKNIEVEEIVLGEEPNKTTVNKDGVKVEAQSETEDGDTITTTTQLGSEGLLVTNNDGDITGVTAEGVAVNGANGTSTLSDNTLAISGKDGQDGILATVTEQGSALSLKGKDGENGITFTATDGENGKSEIRFNDNNGVVDGLKGIVNAATPTDATSPIDITTIQGENRTAYNNQAVSGNDLFNLIDNGLRLAANVLPEGAANVTHKLGNRIDIVKAEGEITEGGKTYIGDNLITKVTQDEDGNSKVEIGLAKNIEVEEIVLSKTPNTTTINGDGVKVETKDGDTVTAQTTLGADGVGVSGEDGASLLEKDGLTVVNPEGELSKVTAEGMVVTNNDGDITGVTADGVAVNGANGTSTLSDNTLAISGKDGQDGILATVTEQGSALSLKGKDGENGITFTATDGENGKSEIRFNDNNGVVDGLKGIVNAATPTDATSPIDITTIQDENRTAYNNQAVSGNDLFNLIDNGLRLAANVLPEGAANVTHKLGNRIDIVKAEGEITEDGKTYIGDNLITKVTQDEDGNSKVEIGLAKNIEVEEIVLSREPNTTTINGDGVKVETKDGDAVTAETQLGADGVTVSGADGESALGNDGLTVVDANGNEATVGADGLSAVNDAGDESKVTAEGVLVSNDKGDMTGVTADGVAVNGANGTSTLSDNTLAISGKAGQDGILATVTEQGSALSLKGKDGENGITFTATDGENGKSEIHFNDNNGVVDGLKGIVNAATPENAAPIDITTIQDENRTAYNNQAVSGNDLFNLIDNGLRLAANVLPEGAANVTHKLGNQINIVAAEEVIKDANEKEFVGTNVITKVTQDEDGNSKVEIGLAKNIEVEEIVLSREPNTTTINGDGVKVETKDGDAVTAETQLGADGVTVSGADGESALGNDGLTVVDANGNEATVGADGLSAVNGAGDESKVTAEGVLVSNDKGDITGVTADGVAVNGANGTSTLSDNTLAISGKDGQDGILATVTEQGSALSLKGKDGENGITFTATDGENGKSEIRFNDNNGMVDGLKGIVNAATPENAAPIDITTIQGENRTAYTNQAVSGNDLFNLIDNGLRLVANVLPEGAANVTHKLGNQINIVAAEEVIKDANEKEFVGTNVITKVTQDEDGNSKVEIGLAKNIEVEEIVLSREPNTTTINGDGVKVETKDGDAVTAETQLGADGVTVSGADGESALGNDGLTVVDANGNEATVGADGLSAVNGAGDESKVTAEGVLVSNDKGDITGVTADGVAVNGANGTSTLSDNTLAISGKDGQDGILATVTEQGSALSLKGKDGENGITFTATDGENGKSEIRFNDNNGVVDGLKGIVNAATPENAAPIDITTIQGENRTAYTNQAVSGNDLFNLIDNGLRLAANVLPEGAANVTHKLGNQINIVAAEEVIKDANEKEFVGTNVITKVTQDEDGNSKVEIGLAKNIEVEEIVLSREPNTTTINGDGVKVETKDGDAVTAETQLGADGVTVSGADGESALGNDGLTVVDANGNEATVGADGLSAVNDAGDESKVTAEGVLVSNDKGDITGVTADGVAVNGANGTSTLSDNTLAISGKDGQDGILATVTEQGSALSLKGKDGENGITFTATDGENGKSEIRFNDNNGQINGLQDRTTANASDYGVDENVNRAATEGAVKAVNDRLNSEVDRITSTGFGVGATVGETQTHQLAKELEIVEAQSDIVDGDKTYVGSNLKTRVTQDESGKTTVEIGLNKNIQLDQLELKEVDPETAEVKDKTLINPTGVTVSGKDGEDGQSSLAKDGLTVKGKDGNDAVTAKADTDGNGSIKVNDAQGNNGVTISAKDGVGTIGLNGKDGANSSIQVVNGVNNLAGEAAQRLVYTNGENVETIASFNDGLAFSGDDNAKVNRTLNTELTLKGGAPTDKLTEGNIAVVKDTADGANGLNIKLAQDVKDLNSVTVGKDPAQQAVLTQDRFAMTTTDGTNSNTFAIENTVNGAKISGVADGDISPTSTEAVNGSQLYSVSRVVGSGDVSIVTTTDKNGNAVEQLVSVDKDGNQYTLTTYNVEGQTEVITNSVITAIHNMNEQGIKFFHTNDGVVQVREEDSNTIDSSAKGKFATAVGYQAKADGEAALAIGRGSQALGDQSVAIGTDNVVRGNNAGAFGDPNIVDADGSYAFGNNNTIGASATNSFVVGSGNNVQTENTYVLGSGIQNTLSNSVFLGNNSGYVAAGRSTAGNQAYENALINGQVHQYAGGKAREVVGVVSVGNVAADGTQETRRIQNVAPGLISRYSTDAINGSQLYSAINNFHAGMNQLGNRMNRIDHDLRSGIAGAVAIGTLVQAYNPSDSVLAIGGGTYRGASAVALGYSKVSDNGRVILKVSGSMNNAGHYMGGASIGYKF